MYQAAIVEDEKDVRDYLKDHLAESFSALGIAVDFDLFGSGEDFLDNFEDRIHYDMIFLDIEMPGTDGLSVCRRIRQLREDALVVFISNREELVFQSFEVQPFRFIRKSHFADFSDTLARDIADRLSRREKRILRITEQHLGTIYSFPVEDLLYVEAQLHNCRFVLKDADYTLQYRFMDVEKLLADEPFIRCHRSYLINCSHILRIGRDAVIMDNKDEIPVSRGRRDAVREAFTAWCMKG